MLFLIVIIIIIIIIIIVIINMIIIIIIIILGGDGATPWLALASHARRPRNGCRLPQILCN